MSQKGTQLNQIINADYDTTVVDDWRSMLRMFDFVAGSKNIINVTTTDPTNLNPSNGNAYFVQDGAVLPWHDNTVQVWRTGVTVGVDNDPVAPFWDEYTPRAGWIFTDLTGQDWKVQTDGSVLKYPYDQNLNIDSDSLFQSVRTPLINAGSAIATSAFVTYLLCRGTATFSGGVTNNGVITGNADSYNIKKAIELTEEITIPNVPENSKFEQLYYGTLTDNQDFPAFSIFSNSNNYKLTFSTASNHKQYQLSEVKHTGEHGWAGGTVEHIEESHVSAGFFINDNSNDPVVTFHAINGGNNSQLYFKNLLDFSINYVCFLEVYGSSSNP